MLFLSVRLCALDQADCPVLLLPEPVKVRLVLLICGVHEIVVVFFIALTMLVVNQIAAANRPRLQQPTAIQSSEEHGSFTPD